MPPVVVKDVQLLHRVCRQGPVQTGQWADCLCHSITTTAPASSQHLPQRRAGSSTAGARWDGPAAAAAASAHACWASPLLLPLLLSSPVACSSCRPVNVSAGSQVRQPYVSPNAPRKHPAWFMRCSGSVRQYRCSHADYARYSRSSIKFIPSKRGCPSAVPVCSTCPPTCRRPASRHWCMTASPGT